MPVWLASKLDFLVQVLSCVNTMVLINVHVASQLAIKLIHTLSHRLRLANIYALHSFAKPATCIWDPSVCFLRKREVDLELCL